ncbi:HPr kinase/phosphorylase [Cohnella zeiphila]|uniref:Aldolase n=1 Tax=Cohnella zeiphila TaxID=2761120 RepID=A0A7X0VYL1_9BACL|nr:aldolase [Cohnella zeiphila]MBB6735126.1 aldolase [Cohnella zeiphila]
MNELAFAERPTVHQAFGLRISSRVPLPELPLSGDAAGGMPADVAIGPADPDKLREELEACGSNFAYSRAGSRFLFLIPDTAVYGIEDGKAIAVAPLPGADREKVRVYLLGTCMGAMLMIRHVLPLHGSAVVIDGKAYAFVGDSGAGKSTLAATFVELGHRLVSDDVVAVSFDDEGCPVVMPSYPQQKLWRESLSGLGKDAAPYRPIFRETDKFAVPVTSGFSPDPVPLAGVFELAKSNRETIGLRSLRGGERLRVVMQHTYRKELVPRLGREEWHFRTSAGIAGGIGACRLERPEEGFTARRLAETIIRFVNKGGHEDVGSA